MVCCGDQFTLALAKDGTIFSWGDGTSGSLGIGNITSKDSI
jgi:alpha-tubulin suppressor-like RCC1 family protein